MCVIVFMLILVIFYWFSLQTKYIHFELMPIPCSFRIYAWGGILFRSKVERICISGTAVFAVRQHFTSVKTYAKMLERWKDGEKENEMVHFGLNTVNCYRSLDWLGVVFIRFLFFRINSRVCVCVCCGSMQNHWTRIDVADVETKDTRHGHSGWYKSRFAKQCTDGLDNVSDLLIPHNQSKWDVGIFAARNP